MYLDNKQLPGRRADRILTTEEKPLVTIITVFCSSEEKINQTAACFLNQTFPFFEWVVVKNRKTIQDNTSELDELAKLDSRLRVVSIDNKESALETIINNANSDIIAFLEEGDLIEPTYIECTYWCMLLNPDADGCCTDYKMLCDKGDVQKVILSVDDFINNRIYSIPLSIRKDILQMLDQTSGSEDICQDIKNLMPGILDKCKCFVHMGWYGASIKRPLPIENSKNVKSKRQNLQVIEYPRYKEMNFERPYKLNWDRKLISDGTKIKVLMIIPYMVMGGADLFNLDVISRMDREKFKFSVITTVPSDSSWRERFEEYSVDVFDLNTFMDVNDWGAFIHYFIKSRNIDIVFISNSFYGYHLVPWISKEFPEVAIVDYVHSAGWENSGGGYARTSGAVDEFIERTYVCNENLRKYMIKHHNKKADDIMTLYIGADEKEYDRKLYMSGSVRKNLGIDDSRPVILFPCRVSDEKRPFLMLAIAKEARKYIPGICFLVIGDGPLYEELSSAVSREGLTNVVYLLGRQNSMIPYYMDADITLICSYREGLTLTAYESLSMGVPVISSDVGGQGELIDNAVGKLLPLLQQEAEAVAGRDYSSEEIKQYVDALMEILGDKDKSLDMKRKSRQRIECGFTKDSMIEKLMGEFYEIINGKGMEKRKKVSEAAKLLANMTDDYLTIYCQEEINTILSARAVRVLNYLNDTLRLKKNPASIIKAGMKTVSKRIRRK